MATKLEDLSLRMRILVALETSLVGLSVEDLQDALAPSLSKLEKDLLALRKMGLVVEFEGRWKAIR
jgi:predicted DNA-binding transcriptional regulator YafY